MLKDRSIRVVVVKEGRGVGIDSSKEFDVEIKYDGKAQVVSLKK